MDDIHMTGPTSQAPLAMNNAGHCTVAVQCTLAAPRSSMCMRTTTTRGGGEGRPVHC